MRIIQRRLAEAIVLELHGGLTRPDANESLIAVVGKVAHTATGRVVLDLDGVPCIDAGGIGSLVAAYGLMTRAGGTLKLARVCSRVYALLVLCRLVPALETFDSVEAAVARGAMAGGDPSIARARSAPEGRSPGENGCDCST